MMWLKKFENYRFKKRIFVIEKSLHSLRMQEEKNQMKKAVDLLYSDYKSDKELTAFTNIDFEDFYEAKWYEFISWDSRYNRER